METFIFSPYLMDTRHIRLCHVIWYGGFSRYGHLIAVPVVHAVRGLSVVDVAELVVLRQVERATTNLRVFSTTIPPSREMFPTFELLYKVELE